MLSFFNWAFFSCVQPHFCHQLVWYQILGFHFATNAARHLFETKHFMKSLVALTFCMSCYTTILNFANYSGTCTDELFRILCVLPCFPFPCHYAAILKWVSLYYLTYRCISLKSVTLYLVSVLFTKGRCPASGDPYLNRCPGEKPQRIFEDHQGCLKICKDLKKIFDDEDLWRPSLGKSWWKDPQGASEDLVRILQGSSEGINYYANLIQLSIRFKGL